ncbi:MAG: TlpA disulfide reductase family protein [Anaerolineae bacterium]
MGRKILLGAGLVLGLSLLSLGTCMVVSVLLAREGIYIPNNPLAHKPADDTGTQTPVIPVGPKVGAEAIDFAVMGIDQQTIQLAQFRGKPVILNFWATWCGPCSAEMPNIEKVYQQHNGAVVFLAVDQGDNRDAVSGYADLYHLHFPILLDPHQQVGDRYRVQALPTTVFIDSKGIIREVHIGGPMSTDYIEGQIKLLEP